MRGASLHPHFAICKLRNAACLVRWAGAAPIPFQRLDLGRMVDRGEETKRYGEDLYRYNPSDCRKRSVGTALRGPALGTRSIPYRGTLRFADVQRQLFMYPVDLFEDSQAPHPPAKAASLAVAPLPAGSDRRLLDDGLMHYEASVGGFSERYRRGETPQTVHVWWARRPHSSMRALLFAALSTNRSGKALELMTALSRQPVNAPDLRNARALLLSDGRRPRVLDMFGGGGTIAFEGATLGLEMYSIDSNELAVFVQRSILVYGATAGRNLVSAVRETGRRVLERLRSETAPLYPARERGVRTYLWSYSIKCKACDYRFFIGKRPWLSRKGSRRLALLRERGTSSDRVVLTDARPDVSESSVWTGRNGTVACPSCSVIQSVSLDDTRDELVVEVGRATKGKNYELASADCLPDISVLHTRERELLARIGSNLPTSTLPRWSGIVNPAIYGMRTHADVFNLRQRVTVLQLIDILQQEHRAGVTRDVDLAVATTSILSGLIDQCVDWNSRLSMWISQNEQVGRGFCGPGIAMLWDYAETDPTGDGPANLWKKLDRIVKGTGAISNLHGPCIVQHAFAQALPFADAHFDAIVTDPPYYDNVFYSPLADFFYAWKRPLLATIEPALFERPATNTGNELVASTIRSGGNAGAAHEQYCQQLTRALHEAARVLKPNGVFALLYSHSSLLGWAALVSSYRASPLRITSVQPLSIERKQRPRAMTSEAVNTCVVFVARPDQQPRRVVSLAELVSVAQQVVSSLTIDLGKAGWNSRDSGIAAYAHCVALLANAAGVHGDMSDAEVLRQLETLVQAKCDGFRVTTRTSL